MLPRLEPNKTTARKNGSVPHPYGPFMLLVELGKASLVESRKRIFDIN